MLAGIGEVQLQNLLTLHAKLSHCSMHKCAIMLGLKLRHHHMIRLYCKYCAMGRMKSAPIGESLPPPKRVLYRVYMDGTGPYVEAYYTKNKYAMQLFEQFTEFTVSLHDQKRKLLLLRAQSWLLNAIQRHYPYRVVELRCDGLPEQKAAAFRAWCVEHQIDLHIGGPYAHHHQSYVEKSHSTVQNYARCQRLRAHMGVDHWSYSNLHATQVKNVIVTARTLRDFKATATMPRPLTPLEKWNEHAAESFASLHANIHPFGCMVVAHEPIEKRAKDAAKGTEGVYLCQSEGGHSVLIISTGVVVTARTVECNPDVFPFEEASKRDNTYHVPWLDPRDRRSSELAPIAIEVSTTKASGNAKLSVDASPSGASVVTKSTPPLATTAHIVKSETFPEGSFVNTRWGKAIIHSVYSDGDLQVSWPNGDSPQAVYTLHKRYVWKESEPTPKGVVVLSPMGLTEHEMCMIHPDNVIGVVNADEVNLPRFHHKKHGHPYEEMIDAAEDLQWTSVNDLKTFGQPIRISTLPAGQKVLRLMWVYAAKPDEFGKLLKIKARIVVVGSAETGDIHWAHAYAPVMNWITVRVMLWSAIQRKGARMWQYDIESAYVTSPSKRKIFVHWPPGKCPKGAEGTCLPVDKALYGLIDSGRCYYEDFTEYHTELGFQQIHYDQCYMHIVALYDDHHCKGSRKGDFIAFTYHVDDNILAQEGEELFKWYIMTLRRKYKFDLRILSYCMGVKFDIDYENGTVFLSQPNQIERMLRDLNYDDTLKVAKSPVSERVRPSLDDATAEERKDPTIQSFPMQAHLGHINFIQQGTHPEVSYALKLASKFATVFGRRHIEWVKHIVRYLKGAKNMGIMLRRVPEALRRILQILSDADHANDPDTRRSISGMIGKLGGSTIFWKCIFQKIVSHSSTESELMSLDMSATIGQYLKWIIWALGSKPTMPIPIFVDCSSCIDIATNPIQPGRNLHVHARYFYVRDFVNEGEYVIHKIDTSDQLSDILVTYKDFNNFSKLRQLLLGCAYVAKQNELFGWVISYL
jgi:hypothetical protein